jgi:hypothetical protein
MKLEKSVQAPGKGIVSILLWSWAWRAALIGGFLLGSRTSPKEPSPTSAPACLCCEQAYAPSGPYDAGVFPATPSPPPDAGLAPDAR